MRTKALAYRRSVRGWPCCFRWCGPGWGQLYNRQIAKGLILIFGLPLLAKIGIGYAFLGAYEALGDVRYLGLLMAGLSILAATASICIYATVDAYRSSQRLNGCRPSGAPDGV
jgi:TM2 domain-containing membrane protein YozV